MTFVIIKNKRIQFFLKELRLLAREYTQFNFNLMQRNIKTRISPLIIYMFENELQTNPKFY